MRLDSYLQKNGLVESRNKAQTVILNGEVSVNGETVSKRSFKVVEGDKVTVNSDKIWVSRGAEKLNGFLSTSSLSVEGKKALDIGASTGGFTEVLLHYGADSITALDVGTLQLHNSLRKDSRVISTENTDIRNFQSEPFPIVVCDVSFISLHSILPSIDRLSSGDIVLLFKPQFEVGRDVKRDRSGVVKEEKAIEKVRSSFLVATEKLGWNLLSVEESKVKGREGNIEYFYHFKK